MKTHQNAAKELVAKMAYVGHGADLAWVVETGAIPQKDQRKIVIMLNAKKIQTVINAGAVPVHVPFDHSQN